MQSQAHPPYHGVTFSQRPPVAQPYRGDCTTKSLKVTGILQIVFGGVSVVLGCVAAGITAFYSYIAIPIWAGLFLFVTTGILGIVSYWKPQKPCHLISYIILSIISACFGFSMFVTYITAAAGEGSDYYGCSPTGDFDWYPCNGPGWSRKLIDALIVLVAAMETASAIVAASMAGYKMCACCRRCCVEISQQQNAHVMYHAAGGGAVPMVVVPANQAATPIYVAGTGQNAISNPQGQQLVFAQPSRQFVVAQPSGQVAQASGPGQQFVVAQPQAQSIGQPAMQVQQRYVVAQPIGQPVVQTNPAQSSQVVATQYPAGQPLAQPRQPAPTYSPYAIQAAPGRVAIPNIQNPVQAQTQASGQTIITGATPQNPAVVQASDPAGDAGHNPAADASQNPAMAQPQAPEETTRENPEDENLTLEASGQTSIGQYSDQSALI